MARESHFRIKNVAWRCSLSEAPFAEAESSEQRRAEGAAGAAVQNLPRFWVQPTLFTF